MSAIALLSNGQITRLVKSGRGLREVASLAGRRYWLIVDAPDEAVQSGQLPRIGLHDRHALLQRRLDAAYPDVRLRAAWMPWLGVGQARFVMYGLPDAAPAHAAWQTLAQEGARLRGVVLVTDLLWRCARREKTAFIAAFLPTGFRLLALHDGLPVLTRRLTLDDPNRLIEELRRTKTYLARQQQLGAATRLICYGQPPQGWRETLSAAWQGEGGIDWREVDVIVLLASAPKGIDLAPAEWRREDRAWRLGRLAITVGVLACLAAGAIGYETFVKIRENEVRIATSQRQIATLEARIAQMTETLRASDLSPALLRQAEALERQWPPLTALLAQDLARLSRLLEAAGGERFDSLTWDAAENAACAAATEHSRANAPGALPAHPFAASPQASPDQPPGAPPLGASASGAGDKPRVRVLEFDLNVPPDLTPRQRARLIENLARQLEEWPGGALKRSPLDRLRREALKSGATEAAWQFCLEASAVPGKPEQSSAP